MIMDIQTANITDLNALRKLEQVCFPKDAWPLFDLMAVLSFPGIVRLKAIQDGKMIGFVAGDPHLSEGIAWIATICILPEWQGQGLGSQLLQACEARLTLPRVRLCVRASNNHAIRMYQKAGYSSVDHWLNYYNDGEHALIMEKKVLPINPLMNTL